MNYNEFENRMRGHAKTTISMIESPFNLKTEINKLEGKRMNKSKNISMFKRMGMIAAVVTVCLITVVAANSEKGFFKDVKRFDGAIVGEVYENAQNEIAIEVNETKVEEGFVLVDLDIEFVDKDIAPFAYIQELAISEYQITNENGEEILSTKNTLENATKAVVEEGKVSLKLALPEEKLQQITNETHFLEIENIYGLAKAEQPLKISGGWKLKF